MDKKPATFYVSYEDPALVAKELERVNGIKADADPAYLYANQDAGDTIEVARKVARKISKTHRVTVFIYERQNIHLEDVDTGIYYHQEWRWDDDDILREDVIGNKIETYAA